MIGWSVAVSLLRTHNVRGMVLGKSIFGVASSHIGCRNPRLHNTCLLLLYTCILSFSDQPKYSGGWHSAQITMWGHQATSIIVFKGAGMSNLEQVRGDGDACNQFIIKGRLWGPEGLWATPDGDNRINKPDNLEVEPYWINFSATALISLRWRLLLAVVSVCVAVGAVYWLQVFLK